MGDLGAHGMFHFVPGKRYTFRFCNYKESWETRHVIFHGVDYGSNKYYPHSTWLLRCWDIERGEPRSFVLSGIDLLTLEEAP